MPQPVRHTSAVGSPGSGQSLFRRVSEPEPLPGSTVRSELGHAQELGDGDTGQGMANQHRCAIVRLLQLCADRCGVVIKPDLPPGSGILTVTGKIKADGVIPQLFKMTCTVSRPSTRRHGWGTVEVCLRDAWFRSLPRDAVSRMIGSRAVLPCLLNSELCSSVPASRWESPSL